MGPKTPKAEDKIGKEERVGGAPWKKQKRQRDGEEGSQAVEGKGPFVRFTTLLGKMKDGRHPLLQDFEVVFFLKNFFLSLPLIMFILCWNSLNVDVWKLKFILPSAQLKVPSHLALSTALQICNPCFCYSCSGRGWIEQSREIIKSLKDRGRGRTLSLCPH